MENIDISVSDSIREIVNELDNYSSIYKDVKNTYEEFLNIKDEATKIILNTEFKNLDDKQEIKVEKFINISFDKEKKIFPSTYRFGNWKEYYKPVKNILNEINTQIDNGKKKLEVFENLYWHKALFYAENYNRWSYFRMFLNIYFELAIPKLIYDSNQEQFRDLMKFLINDPSWSRHLKNDIEEHIRIKNICAKFLPENKKDRYWQFIFPWIIYEKCCKNSKGKVNINEDTNEEDEELNYSEKYNPKDLFFDDSILKSFYTALKTKGFVILAGLSGTGKTKIFEDFVKQFEKPKTEIAPELIIENEMQRNCEEINKYEENSQQKLKEFQGKYTDEFINDMNLSDWHDRKSGLIYDLEFGKYKSLGNIGGNPASKYGIYKSVGDCFKTFKKENNYCFKKELGEKLATAFKNLKRELISIRRAAIHSDLESIENSNVFSNLVKRKLAFMWNPTLIINIFSDEHLKRIAEIINIKGHIYIDLQENIKKYRDDHFIGCSNLCLFKVLFSDNFEKIGDTENNIFIPIRPDFKDSKSLLGYYNPLTECYSSTSLLDFIFKAIKNYGKNGSQADPFFVLFDEMNLARVEYYFADFLSVFESKKFTSSKEASGNIDFKNFCDSIDISIDENNFCFTSQSIKLHNIGQKLCVPEGVYLPPNIYFIGTVNIDETTHMFSPKVLDRAFTLEFDVQNFQEYLTYLNKIDHIRNESSIDKNDFINYGRFVSIDNKVVCDFFNENIKYVELLQRINDILMKDNLHFGYRVFNEIGVYLSNWKSAYNTDIDKAFDHVLKMKILPKFHGTRQRLEEPIVNLLELLCNMPEEIAEKDNGDTVQELETSEKIARISDLSDEKLERLINSSSYPYTGKKLAEMLKKIRCIGFASFM